MKTRMFSGGKNIVGKSLITLSFCLLFPLFFSVFCLAFVAFSTYAEGQQTAQPASSGAQKQPTTPPPSLSGSPGNPTNSSSNALPARVDDAALAYLEKRADGVERREAQIEKLLGLLTLITSLYALVLGLAAYTNFKQLVENGEKEVTRIVSRADQLLDDAAEESKRALERVQKDSSDALAASKTELADFRDEVRRDIPEIQRLDTSVRELLAELNEQLKGGEDWLRQQWFEKIGDYARQQVHISEIRVGALEPFALGKVPRYKASWSEIYQRLGIFYLGRCAFAVAQQRTENAIDDWNRALLYMDRSCSINQDNAESFRLRGVIYSRPAPGRPVDFSSAERDFKIALSLANDTTPTTLLALFGLAWLKDEQHDYDASIEALDSLVDKGEKVYKGEKLGEESANILSMGFYNRACSQARKAQLDNTPETEVTTLLERAMKDCEKTVEYARGTERKQKLSKLFDKDMSADGDLALLAASGQYAERIARVRQSLRS